MLLSVSLLVKIFLLLLLSEVRPSYSVDHISGDQIEVDGQVDDLWLDRDWSTEFEYLNDTGSPEQATRFKSVRSDKTLFFLIEVSEQNIEAEVRESGITLHDRDDAVELFIDSDGDGEDYIEMQVNAHNTIYQLQMSKPYNDGGKKKEGNIPNLKTGVSVMGTLNEPGDVDTVWYVEIGMPLDYLRSLCKEPNTDLSNILINVARVEQMPSSSVPRYHVWAKTGAVNLHIPNKWGQLYLK